MQGMPPFGLGKIHDNAGYKVTIVHEDSVAGIQAVDFLGRLTARLGARLNLDINPWQFYTRAWKFDWLRDSKLWSEAVAKSVEADMIILASRVHGNLPAPVRSWIESVMPRKQSKPAALVALLDGRCENGFGALPPARYLRLLAERYGVDFVCNLDDDPQRMERTWHQCFSNLNMNFIRTSPHSVEVGVEELSSVP
jgi:hypothetical protein